MTFLWSSDCVTPMGEKNKTMKINKAHKGGTKLTNIIVCSVFFFKDAYASMKGTINIF